jgi:hypothetical protein
MVDDESTQVLNFSAKLISDYPEDRRRQFVVSYYLSDRTLSIFEVQVSNSGFRGGKFLQRTRVRDPTTKKFFEPHSFYVGAKIQVSARTFELLEAAPHTFGLMESRADDFPEADVTQVVKHLIDVLQGETSSLRSAFEKYDPRGTGFVSVEEAKEIYSKFIPKLTRHAVLTLTRAFDRNNGTYDYGLLLKYLRA